MKPPSVRPPLFMMVFFALFGCIGITLLVFLWSADDGFGSPPLFFRVMGSFIALGFVAMGFGVPLAALKKNKSSQGETRHPNAPAEDGYRCPNCGAALKEAEVSPSGDVKCPYCKGWWNIHR